MKKVLSICFLISLLLGASLLGGPFADVRAEALPLREEPAAASSPPEKPETVPVKTALIPSTDTVSRETPPAETSSEVSSAESSSMAAESQESPSNTSGQPASSKPAVSPKTDPQKPPPVPASSKPESVVSDPVSNAPDTVPEEPAESFVPKDTAPEEPASAPISLSVSPDFVDVPSDQGRDVQPREFTIKISVVPADAEISYKEVGSVHILETGDREVRIQVGGAGELIVQAEKDGRTAKRTIQATKFGAGTYTGDISGFADEIFRLVNEEREKAGLGPYQRNSLLESTANLRAEELPWRYSHTRPDGSLWKTAFPPEFSDRSENILYGSTSPKAAMNAWMNSPGHRGNILNKRWTDFGIGIYRSGGVLYWVQGFGCVEDARPAPDAAEPDPSAGGGTSSPEPTFQEWMDGCGVRDHSIVLTQGEAFTLGIKYSGPGIDAEWEWDQGLDVASVTDALRDEDGRVSGLEIVTHAPGTGRLAVTFRHQGSVKSLRVFCYVVVTPAKEPAEDPKTVPSEPETAASEPEPVSEPEISGSEPESAIPEQSGE